MYSRYLKTICFRDWMLKKLSCKMQSLCKPRDYRPMESKVSFSLIG